MAESASEVFDSLVRDFRYGIRTLARTPGFSVIAIIVMALGIGATAALFTVVHSVLLKPLPLPDVDRLVMIYEADTKLKFNNNSVAGGTFHSWEQENRTFQHIAISSESDGNFSSSDGQLPERIHAVAGSWAALSVLGVQPVYGRLFTPDDDKFGANETTVLTWGFWKRRFGGNPGIIGHTILLDSKPYTVIGILPAWFAYPNPRVQLWVPVYPEVPPQVMASHDSHNFRVIGKLKAGVSVAAAQADLSNISAQVRRQLPEGPVFDAAYIRPLLDAETYQIKTLLYALFAATGCLLLIACLNIANLLVARSASRRRESAIRTALGGTKVRLLRERVTESILLSLAGGVLGLLFAQVALQWLVHQRSDLPRAESIHLDLTAILFSIGLAALCGIAAGLAPALVEDEEQVLRTLQESSRSVSGSRGSITLRRALLSVEVALTVVLLVGAGLFLRSFQRLRAVDIGVPTGNILHMSINLPEAAYKEGAKKLAFIEQLLERVNTLPGVRAAGISTCLPGQGHCQDDAFTIPEIPPPPKGQWLDASVRFVDPGYFKAVQIPLLRGRYFSPNERLARRKYVIVSESFVRQFLPSGEVLGKHVDDLNNGELGEKSVSNEIVGVVGDVREVVNREPRPTVYYPLYGGLRGDLELAVRTASDPLSMALPVQRVVAQLDPAQPVADVLSLDQIVGKDTAAASFDAMLLLVFATLSLILAAVGLFGVLSFIVAQRQSEIGIRIALGAQREDVLRLVLADGLRPAFVGLILGIAASAAVTRFISSLLYGTKPLDPIVYVLVTLALLAVATIACLVPAWRASHLDPMQALRTE
ncbi:MAG TPA: ABC transporter permease [Silvibacterium sp.]|nr:ABC transporter permease [Silvibacterium sp.]